MIKLMILDLSAKTKVSPDLQNIKIITFSCVINNSGQLTGEIGATPAETPPPGTILLVKVIILLLFDIVKLREREGQRVDLGRSLKGHL